MISAKVNSGPGRVESHQFGGINESMGICGHMRETSAEVKSCSSDQRSLQLKYDCFKLTPLDFAISVGI